MKNLLNRRNVHLKGAMGENDPFKTTVKGLYQKANDQEKGPLFDEEDGKEYRDNDDFQTNSGNSNLNKKTTGKGLDIPNYKAILQRVQKKSSAVKKSSLEEEEKRKENIGDIRKAIERAKQK